MKMRIKNYFLGTPPATEIRMHIKNHSILRVALAASKTMIHQIISAQQLKGKSGQ